MVNIDFMPSENADREVSSTAGPSGFKLIRGTGWGRAKKSVLDVARSRKSLSLTVGSTGEVSSSAQEMAKNNPSNSGRRGPRLV